MGRWKMGPNGGYWDANDSGPDQMTPTPETRAQVGQSDPNAIPAPGSGAATDPSMGSEPGGFTGGEEMARRRWEAQNPGQPYPGNSPVWGDGSGGQGQPVPTDITPAGDGLWSVGGEQFDLPDLLSYLRGTLGGGPIPVNGVGGGSMGQAIAGSRPSGPGQGVAMGLQQATAAPRGIGGAPGGASGTPLRGTGAGIQQGAHSFMTKAPTAAQPSFMDSMRLGSIGAGRRPF